MIALINKWEDALAKTMIARKLKPSMLHSQLETLRELYGKFRLSDVLESDGMTTAHLSLFAKHGNVDMKLTLNPENGKVLNVMFYPSA